MKQSLRDYCQGGEFLYSNLSLRMIISKRGWIRHASKNLYFEILEGVIMVGDREDFSERRGRPVGVRNGRRARRLNKDGKIRKKMGRPKGSKNKPIGYKDKPIYKVTYNKELIDKSKVEKFKNKNTKLINTIPIKKAKKCTYCGHPNPRTGTEYCSDKCERLSLEYREHIKNGEFEGGAPDLMKSHRIVGQPKGG